MLAIDQVTNTSDAAKPVSTAQATAIGLKVDKTTSIVTTAPLTGGGDLSTTRTLAVSNFAGSAPGAVPTSPGGITGFLRADGTWAAPSGSAIVQSPTPPSDTTVLWADTSQVGIEENVRYLKTVSTTTYTLVLADRGKLLLCANAAAQTVTVPTNASAAFVIGTQLDLVQTGAGVLTIAAAGGVTVNATPSLAFRAQYSAASLIKTATDTWLLVGDLA